MTLQQGNRIGNTPKGGPLSARKLNQFERRVLQGTRATPGQVVKSNQFGTTVQDIAEPGFERVAVAGSSVRTVKLVRVLDDHLECEDFDGKTMNVLKPDPFRPSRWHGKKRNGVTMNFHSPDLQQVVATKAGAKTEVWKITPFYIGSSSLPVPPGLDQADWLKIATLDEDGKTDFSIYMKTLDIEWYDTNEAGRVWGLDITEF